jgi:hypothetical protein
VEIVGIIGAIFCNCFQSTGGVNECYAELRLNSSHIVSSINCVLCVTNRRLILFSTEYLNTLFENCLSFDRSRARPFYGTKYVTLPKDLKCLSQRLIKYNVGRRKREWRNISMHA